MPTYDYHCTACGHRFEEWQQISEPKLRTCPKCKKRKLERLVGAGAGLIFRGTGFYVTDYKRKGAPPSESAASGSSGGTGSDGSKGDAKGSSKESGSKAAKPSSKASKPSGGSSSDASSP
jgi:putative FmdB family regulatory protein